MSGAESQDGMASQAMATDIAMPGWTSFDTHWVIGLIGTAVGAGILFLPINAGLGGFWPLLLTTLLVGPMTYYSHRGLSRMVCASSKPSQDITQVVSDYFGENTARFVNILYFLAAFPVVLIYGVGITNIVQHLITQQLGWQPWPRWLLSGILVFSLSGVMVAGKHVMLMMAQWIVYPLILALAVMTVYLIPHWSFEGFARVPRPGHFVMSTWLMIPVLVFSFEHVGAISQFSVSLKQKYGRFAEPKASSILFWTTTLLVIFTMGFVWSSVLAIGPAGLEAARQANLPVLSYLADQLEAPFIAWLGPAIAIAAITSSFFGHWLGAEEGVIGLVRGFVDPDQRLIGPRMLRRCAMFFIFVSTWLVGIINPSILSLLESLIGPVVACVLYLLPMYAIRRVPALAHYRGQLSNVFVVVAGLIAVGGMLLSIFN